MRLPALREERCARLYFNVHGLRVRYLTSRRILDDEASRDLGRYRVEENPTGEFDVSLAFRELRSRVSYPPPQGAVRDAFVPGVEIYTKGKLRSIILGSHGSAKIDLESVRVDAALGRVWMRSFMPRALLKWSIIKGQEKKGMFSIHSSGIGQDGRILLFNGPAGAGKTYTLLNFLLRGYAMLADDIMFFQEGTIFPFLMRSDLRQDTVERLIARIRPANDVRWRDLKPGLTDLARFFVSNQQPQRGDLSVFHLSVWNSRRTKVSKLDSKTMLGVLLESYLTEFNNSFWFGWKKSETISRIIDAYTELLKNAKCFRVYAGSDPEHLYHAIESSG